MTKTIDINLIQTLRQRTGLGMMDCKNALTEASGDIEKAIELLRKKGAAVAAKRSDKDTGEGLVHAYIHPGARVGVLVELNCETDFVARTEDIKQFANDLGLHITALKPLYLAPEDVDPKWLENERRIFTEQMQETKKPENIINQIVDGKIKKVYSEVCLLQQPFVKNDQQTVEEVLRDLIAKTGENIRIRRFARFEIGA